MASAPTVTTQPVGHVSALQAACHCLFFFLLIYLFLAVLGLRFCARALSSCGKWGPLFIAVRGPLTVAASLVAEHRLQTRRLSNHGSRAQPLRGMWDPPRPGLEPVSPALAGRFSTTAPPGKPLSLSLMALLTPLLDSGVLSSGKPSLQLLPPPRSGWRLLLPAPAAPYVYLCQSVYQVQWLLLCLPH